MTNAASPMADLLRARVLGPIAKREGEPQTIADILVEYLMAKAQTGDVATIKFIFEQVDGPAIGSFPVQASGNPVVPGPKYPQWIPCSSPNETHSS